MADMDVPKDVARELIRGLLTSFHSLENATRLVQELCSDQEFREVRSEAGRVAGGLCLLLEPLWKAYPDLAPEGLVMSPRKKTRSVRSARHKRLRPLMFRATGRRFETNKAVNDRQWRKC